MAHLGAAVQTQDFEARGVDDRTRYQLRSATYGTDAAQALARLDQEERAWNQKLDDYVLLPRLQQFMTLARCRHQRTAVHPVNNYAA